MAAVSAKPVFIHVLLLAVYGNASMGVSAARRWIRWIKNVGSLYISTKLRGVTSQKTAVFEEYLNLSLNSWAPLLVAL